MDPMLHHMHAAIQRAGDEWKVEQGAKASTASADSINASRSWPLLVAASGEAELTALREIREKHEASRFNCLKPGTRTLLLSNRLFKLLTRQGSRFYWLLTRHGHCPFLIFGLLLDPQGTKAKLKATCRAAMDEYTRSFLDYYTFERCTCKEALAELTLLNVMVELSTLALENGNAGIRHSISVMSTHVKLPPIGRTSADRLMATIRSWCRSIANPAGMRETERKQRVGPKQRCP